jgi:hypothetical protein
MKNTYDVAIARDEIKELNDYLFDLGAGIQERTVKFDDLVNLMTNPEFMRLMTNVRFFAEEGNKYMAEVYENLSKMYENKAETA